MRDEYKGSLDDVIKAHLDKQSIPVVVALMNLTSDFNKSSALRNANNFGVRNVVFVGGKKWDRRGAVGAHNYMNIYHAASILELTAMFPGYTLVGIEQTESSVKINRHLWQAGTIMLFGEEQNGLSDEALAMCDAIVEIPSMGSVRSINVASACGIALYDYCLYMGSLL